MAVGWLRPSPRPSQLGPAESDPREAARIFAGARIVFQPVISVATGSLFAAEALTRFAHPDESTPIQVFGDAHSTGFGPALESLCMRAALTRRGALPASTLIAINLSPDGLQKLATERVWPADLTGVIVEVTEQDILHPDEFAYALAALRERGAALAIDDVGSGYAGLLRLAEHRPDYVKIDRRIVTGVGDSDAQAAVLESLVTLSHRLGAAVIGEGVEDLADLQALGEYDVDYAQGYAIAEPSWQLAEIDAAVVQACRAGRKRLLHGPAGPGDAAARTRDVYAVTAALAAAGDRDDITGALAHATAELRVNAVSVSLIAEDDTVREIAVLGTDRDSNRYRLADFQATTIALQTGRILEVHAADAASDPAELGLMQGYGYVSMLLVPISVDGRPIGLLEFSSSTSRRWNVADIAYAQGLASHLGPVLLRLGAAVSA